MGASMRQRLSKPHDSEFSKTRFSGEIEFDGVRHFGIGGTIERLVTEPKVSNRAGRPIRP